MALLEEWNGWTDVADLDGLFNLYGLQALAARMMFIDGEVFVRFTTDADGSLRLQLLPAEFIDTTITRDHVIAGVEFDEGDVLGNSPAIIRKHHAKWNVQRQDRIKSLMQTVHSGTFLARKEKAAVTV